MDQCKIFRIVVPVLIGVIIILGFVGFSYQREIDRLTTISNQEYTNQQTLNFLEIFIKKVLKSDKEVDFETRLKLENAVRDLKDDKILAQWQSFVNSKDELEAQNNVKDLLELLVVKVRGR
jgi:hypothetical protein